MQILQLLTSTEAFCPEIDEYEFHESVHMTDVFRLESYHSKLIVRRSTDRQWPELKIDPKEHISMLFLKWHALIWLNGRK